MPITDDVQVCRRCGKVFEGVPRRAALALRLHERANHAGAPAPSEAEARDATNAAMKTVIAKGGDLTEATKSAGSRAHRRKMARAAVPSGAAEMFGAIAARRARNGEPQPDE